jgi:hypothetical protein
MVTPNLYSHCAPLTLGRPCAASRLGHKIKRRIDNRLSVLTGAGDSAFHGGRWMEDRNHEAGKGLAVILSSCLSHFLVRL